MLFESRSNFSLDSTPDAFIDHYMQGVYADSKEPELVIRLSSHLDTALHCGGVLFQTLDRLDEIVSDLIKGFSNDELDLGSLINFENLVKALQTE